MANSVDIAQMNECGRLQKILNQIDDNVRLDYDPERHKPYRAMHVALKEEMEILKMESMMVRRFALKKLIEKDHTEIENALLRLGLGFISTQP